MVLSSTTKASAFSFFANKIVTTGEGGMVVTDNDELADRCRYKKNLCFSMDGIRDYTHNDIGFNYRMSELQAALGISQMRRLDEFVAMRHKHQRRYDVLLQKLPVITPFQDKDCYSSLHLYSIQIEQDKISKSRKQVFKELRENGIGVNVHYIPVHVQPYYQDIGFKYGDFPQSENYYKNAITIPLFPGLTIEMQDKIVKVLKEVLI